MREVVKQKLWREAWERVQLVERSWGEEAERVRLIEECRGWLAAQVEEPYLARLSTLMQGGMTQRQLWSVLVPIERKVARLRVTDVDILSSDIPEGEGGGELMPLTVVVDSLRSAFNVGGILRTAECFGVAEVVLCGYTPLPDQAQVARAALGTERRVRWRSGGRALDVVRELRGRGVECVALETVAGAAEVGRFEWGFPCALVVGNERFGLDPEVVAACSGVVRIAHFGLKNSLNVVAAFAVAVHEIRRRYGCGGCSSS